MANPKIYADFHNADSLGRVRLNCAGTAEDLSQQQVELREGLVLTLYADDLDERGHADELLVDGAVLFSEEEHCWVASIDWMAVHHASDENRSNNNRLGSSALAAYVQGRVDPNSGEGNSGDA